MFHYKFTAFLLLLWMLFNVSVVVVTLLVLHDVHTESVNDHVLNLAKVGNWIAVSWYILIGTFLALVSVHYLRRPGSSVKDLSTLGLYAKPDTSKTN